MKYYSALKIIAHMGISGLSWQHDYEKCVNIAKEALEIITIKRQQPGLFGLLHSAGYNHLGECEALPKA